MQFLRPGEIRPVYDGDGLANLTASICGALGAPIDGPCPPLTVRALKPALLQGPSIVILLVVDGLGQRQLQAALREGRMPRLAEALQRPQDGQGELCWASLRTLFPTSTVPGLATLFSGLPPSQHALLGWTIYVEELGGAVEVARWGPAGGTRSFADPELGGLSPEAFFGHETLAERLARAGVSCHALGPREYQRSSLTRMIHRGARYHPYDDLRQAFEALQQILVEKRGERSFVAFYWPRYDQLAHDHGPASVQALASLGELDNQLGRWLVRHQPRDLLLLATADHGQAATPAEAAIVLNDRPELQRHLSAPPVGERRGLFLHVRPGQMAAVRDWLAENIGDAASAVEPDALFSAGFFGPSPTALARRRAGDLVLLAHGPHQLNYSHASPPRPKVLPGNHGGLTCEEVEIPLVAWRT